MAELILSGFWSTNKYIAVDPLIDVVVYRRWNSIGTESAHAKFNLSYTKSTGLWSQGPGIDIPFFLNSVDSFSTATPELADAHTIYAYTNAGDLYFWFDSPYYLKPQDDIHFSAGAWLNNYYYKINPLLSIDNTYTDGTSYRFYELRESATDVWVGGVADNVYGFEIQYVLDNGVVKNRLVVNSGNNDQPKFYSVNNILGTYENEFWIESGDVVRGFGSNQASVNDAELRFEFTCFPGMLYRSLPVVDPPDDDPPENDPPSSPIFVTRSGRRGNLNFW